MAASHETVAYDVRDCKVYPLTTDTVGASAPAYGAAVDVPGIAEVSFEANLVTAELKGDSTIIAKKGRIDKINVSATYGKLSLDVLNVIMQGTVSDAGAGDAETADFLIKGTNELPYFKMEVLIDDVQTGLAEIAVVLYKCQLTSTTFLSQSSDEFGQPELEAEAIRLDSSDDMILVQLRETAAGLST